MKVPILTTDGKKDGDVDLPLVFSTEFRKDLIHKAFTNLNSHKFQPQGRHPTAGMDVVARSNDCLLYTSPSPRDRTRSRMPSSA